MYTHTRAARRGPELAAEGPYHMIVMIISIIINITIGSNIVIIIVIFIALSYDSYNNNYY